MDREIEAKIAHAEPRSCVCHRDLHNYTVFPAGPWNDPREKRCCRCPEDCLCH